MFVLENDKKKIGMYLSNLISQKFMSVRQFGKACIEQEGRIADNEEIRKMSNRLSQILNGKKSIQIYDLPVFTKLLEVSCEEILSAGQCFIPTSSHLTNYTIAHSMDEKVWDEYIHREDKLILNAVEYDKTVIDYALECKNYELLKYLTSNNYIWFVGADKNDYFSSFGAGTSIKGNSCWHTNINVLDIKLKENHKLRMKMILLALEHNDTEMLTELRAREIPSLYQACYLSCTPADCEKYYDHNMLLAIADASGKILDYFSEEYEINDRFDRVNKFLFPFTGELIDLLIQKNNNYAERLLKNAINHNQYVYNKLTVLLKNAIHSYPKEYLKYETTKKDIIKSIMQEVTFYDNGCLISYRDTRSRDGIISNIIHTKVESSNSIINGMSEDVNNLYNKIHNLESIINQEI